MKKTDGKINVIGIDPSPGKGSTVFDGKSFLPALGAKELHEYLDTLGSKTLVCWDAPLTGPATPDVVMSHHGKQRPYTQRLIEQFFSSQNEIKAPNGISVRPYSGCSHWTLSRALLGLPRVGKWDCPLQNLPFELVEEDDAKKRDWTKRKVVEVHPALALFLWSERDADESWEYKNKKDTTVFDVMKEEFLRSLDKNIRNSKPVNDDQLDALVAYVLGRRWLDGDEVVLLGSKDTGHFLVPSMWKGEDVKEKFGSFEKWVKQHAG